MELLDAVDVLIHPTAVDALGVVLLEAMAAGVPVIATAVGGIPEVLEHERTGLLIEPPPRPEPLAKALGPLLEEPERRRRLAEAAKERFEEEFTAERWAERLRPVYEEAIAG
jgi:glycosyltransferase involved in cell wall biosynthesis